MTGLAGVFSWIAVAVVLFIVEMSVYQLVSIWFSAGAVAAAFPAAMGAQFWVQLLIFLIVSVLFLFVARPLIKKKLKVKRQPTNSDMVVGQNGIVLEEIDNMRQTGRVSAMGLTWMARTDSSETIAAGSEVLVNRIEGVKLIVEPVRQASYNKVLEYSK